MADATFGERPGRLLAIAVLTGICLEASAASARVQPYQIVRLITFKTECQIQTIEDRSPPTGPMRFVAQCENVSFYPEGVEVICDDREDDRSCHATTKAKRFDSLNLLSGGH